MNENALWRCRACGDPACTCLDEEDIEILNDHLSGVEFIDAQDPLDVEYDR